MPKLIIENPPRRKSRKRKSTKARRRRRSRSTTARTRTITVARKSTRRRRRSTSRRSSRRTSRRSGSFSPRGFITKDLAFGIAGGVTGAVIVPLIESKISTSMKVTSLPAKLAIQSGLNLGVAFAAHKMKQRAFSQGVLVAGGSAVAAVGIAKLLTPKTGTVKGINGLIEAPGVDQNNVNNYGLRLSA